ncbi:MAG TPA: hypothetical protein VK484_12410 [Ferruginibacter sp.]|nr:hypothetical protein [Ferruginibacter sp.]
MPLIKKIRLLIIFFMVALILSGVTAMPIETELRWLMQYRDMMPDKLGNWLQTCYEALVDTNNKYPFLAYGYDWLAFAHIVIALSFIGPYRDPVKNIWIIDWQIITCIAVLPLAFIAGPIRQIPIFHILIDCCFGLLGIIPLLICRKWIKQLAATQ